MSTLILSGWTQPSDALSILADDAQAFDYSDHAPEDIYTKLAAFRDVKHIIAWSLGGHLALQAMLQGALKPNHLTLIAAPYQFVTHGGIQGMDPLTFVQFRQNYEKNPTRTKARFHALVAKGDSDADGVLAQLTHHAEVENVARWLPWLDWLGDSTLIDADLSPMPPTLIVHGEQDGVVPVGQSDMLAEKLPKAIVHRWTNVSHAPHLHDVTRLRAEIAAHREGL